MLTTALLNIGTTAYVAYGALSIADSTGSSPSIESFLQYGVLGLVVIGFLTGWIVPGPQAKQLISENQRLTALLEKEVIPMSATFAATMDRSNSALEKAALAMEAIKEHLDDPPSRRRGEGG